MASHQPSTLVGILCALTLTGCASLSKEECIQADWRLIGFEDGAKGRASSYLGNHREACAEYGITPDQTRYRMGREEGLTEYCRPYNGYQEGLKGASYQGVCPADLQDAFVDAHRYGKQIHEATQAMESREQLVRDAEDDLKKIKQRQRDAEAQLIDAKTSKENRAALLQEVKELAREQGEKEAEIGQLKEERVRFEAEIQHLKAHSPYE